MRGRTDAAAATTTPSVPPTRRYLPPQDPMARLPNDAWVAICDSTGTGALSRTCVRLWQLLQKRHVKARGTMAELGPWLESCPDLVSKPFPTSTFSSWGGVLACAHYPRLLPPSLLPPYTGY